jgi:hypothetical protein
MLTKLCPYTKKPETMQLFTDFESLKKVVGSGNIDNSLEAIEPFIEQAVEEFIAPIFGYEFVQKASELILEDNMEQNQIRATKLLQASAGNLAYLLLSLDGGLLVDDSGFHRMDNGQTRSAYQWQMNNFRRARQSAGWNALRRLYIFMESNEVEELSDVYIESEERIYMRSLFLNTDLDFRRTVKIQGFETWWELRGYMETIQETVVKPLITEEVFNVLTALRLANDESEEEGLFTLVKNVIAAGTMDLTLPMHLFSVEKGGLIISEFISNKDNSHSEKQATEFVTLAKGRVSQLFHAAKEALAKYMEENAEDYPSYKEKVLEPALAAQAKYAQLKEANKKGKIVRL